MTGFTKEQVADLTEAIAQGVNFVEQNGKKVQYRSIKDMIALRDRMIREIESRGDAPPRPLAFGSVYLKR